MNTSPNAVGPARRTLPRTFTCRTLNSRVPVSARQERVFGWDQRKLDNSIFLVAGAGGLGGEIGEGLVQKGAGHLHVADFDIVTPSNLSRQKFTPRDLWKNKAKRLCRSMSRRGCMGTRLIAHACAFQELGAIHPDVVIAAVDNQIPTTRLDICRWAHSLRIPAVLLGVTPDADGGYVLVQTPGNACWACAMHIQSGEPNTQSHIDRCPEAAASVDILKTLSGIALYAVDTLIMARPREWNYWSVSLRRREFGGATLVAPRPGCMVCGGASP